MNQVSLDGLPEDVRELTIRAAEALPRVGYDELPEGEDVYLVEFMGFLDHPIFDALYSVGIYVGDFGIYRVGDLHSRLIPSQRTGAMH